MAYTRASNRMVTCPYDESHRLKESKLQMHITKCKLNHLDVEKKQCPFNAQHRIDPGQFDYHLLNCPNNDVVDRRAVENNTYKGFTGVPCYNQEIPMSSDECWDNDIAAAAAPRYIPQRFPPNNGIVEPLAMSKPADRRRLYKELHTMHGEPETEKFTTATAPLTDNTRNNEIQPTLSEGPSTVLHYPKRPAEQNFQNLGLGRASSNSRIAANIFGPKPTSSRPTYSDMAYDASLLGVGRGRSNPAAKNMFLDSDFPDLGFGRGARR